MKQVSLFLGLSLLMGTIALFTLCGYDSINNEFWLANGVKIASAHAAAIDDATSDTQTPFAEGCDKCHGNEPAYQEWRQAGHSHALVNLIEGPYELRTSCLSCHSAGYETFSDRVYPGHTYNIETAVNAVSCASCHSHTSKSEHLLVKPAKHLCVTCHKMDCGCAGAGIVHQSQSEMFLGREGAGVKRMPSPHVRVMKKRCVQCHMTKEDPKMVAQHGGHTFKAELSVCSTAGCHDSADNSMEVKLPQYRTEIEAKMQAVKTLLDAARNKTSQAYLDAKLNYDMVKGDSGYGLHNIPYANALLDYSLSLKSGLE
jgi:predicted CXXCH cytochrome family protein